MPMPLLHWGVSHPLHPHPPHHLAATLLKERAVGLNAALLNSAEQCDLFMVPPPRSAPAEGMASDPAFPLVWVRRPPAV